MQLIACKYYTQQSVLNNFIWIQEPTKMLQCHITVVCTILYCDIDMTLQVIVCESKVELTYTKLHNGHNGEEKVLGL